MALSTLVLANIVHQNLEPAIHAAVIEVKSEPPDLERPYRSDRQTDGIARPPRRLQQIPVSPRRKTDRLRSCQPGCLGARCGSRRDISTHVQSRSRQRPYVVPRWTSGSFFLQP